MHNSINLERFFPPLVHCIKYRLKIVFLYFVTNSPLVTLLQVDAYPAAVTFSWFFNNSEHQEALEDERFTTSGLVSTLNFAPTTNQDYGTLFCLGENAVGHQEEPCAFKIVPTGKLEVFERSLCCYISQRQKRKSSLCCQDSSHHGQDHKE